MYTQHFGLTAEPFALTPDPAFLYLSPAHAEALAALKVGLQSRRGLLVMTGEVGTGKTTVLYSLLEELGTLVRTAYVANTSLSFDEMLYLALLDFGVAVAGRERGELLIALNSFLVQCAVDGVTAALVIDEAQNLDDGDFEHLRLLSNFETFSAKLLQIVLVGQPELEAKLRRPSLRQVADRVAIHCHVNPLGHAESRAYVSCRLGRVGSTPDLFTRSALGLALRHARGSPRRINILCHNALLFAYGRGARRVTRAHVRAAVRERNGCGLITVRRDDFAQRIRGAGLRIIRLFPALIRPRAAQTSRRAQRPAWLASAVGVVGLALLTAGGVALISAHARHLLARQALLWSLQPSADAPSRKAAPDPPVTTSQVAAANIAPLRTIVVYPGATLKSLVRLAYGTVTPEHLALVRNANPQIRHADRILAGDTLHFPDTADITRPRDEKS